MIFMFKECQKFLNRNLPSQEFGRTKVWPLWARTGIPFRKKLSAISIFMYQAKSVCTNNFSVGSLAGNI